MLNLFDKKIKNTFPIKKSNETNLKPLNFTLSIANKKDNVIGDTKHYTPAVKEWPNNIYLYNRNSVKLLPSKHKAVDSLIKSYLNIISFYKIKDVSKSKRARMTHKKGKSLRKSAKRSFISKTQLKHSNDKVIINVYILDKLKQSLTRKISFINRSFSLKKPLQISNFIRPLNYTTCLKDNNSKQYLVSNKKYILSYLNTIKGKQIANQTITQKTKFFTVYLNNKLNNLKRLNRIKSKMKSSLSKSNKYLIKKTFKKKLATSIIDKKMLLKNIFFFSFLKWTLWLFKIKVYFIGSKKKMMIALKITNTKMFFLRKNIGLIVYLKKINNILLHLLIISLKNTVKSNIINSKERKIYYLFKFFKNRYYKRFLNKYLRKQILALHYLYMFSINNFKFDKFLPGVKILANKIFNKKIELNIINLKYLHLNSDIFSEVIATKLMKKKSRLLLILKRSLKLVKLPSKISIKNMFDTENSTKLLNKSFLNRYKNANINNLECFKIKKSEPKDILQGVLRNIYTFYKLNFSTLNELKQRKIDEINIFNSIKFKWIKGVKVEAKGRLTKRYTASRSVFKLKYKGNLKNIDAHNGLSSIMLRGDVKPNMEYSFKKSWKRIGAFGIKGWISSK
jgi:hypothetical protein